MATPIPNHDVWLASQLGKTAEIKRLTERLEGCLRVGAKMGLNGQMMEAKEMARNIELELGLLQNSIDALMKS